MWVLGIINRWVLLTGLPLLRRIPFVRDLPFIRGHFRIRAFDFPQSDRARLRSVVNRDTAAFLGPNHPEFGLDWMMDKELSTRVAPRMASWAAHGIVAAAPRFWTRNNLVSNNGGDAARHYSIAWAMRGHGVLLHPEGSVRWTSDKVHPLFHGIAEMAVEAARRLGDEGSNRSVFVVPIVWKYRYVFDVSARMHREMDTIERGLSLSAGPRSSVAERFCLLQENILARQMTTFGFDRAPVGGDFFSRQRAFQMHLLGDLVSAYAIEPADSIDRTIGRIRKAIARSRENASDDSQRSARLERDLARLEEASRLGGFSRDVYGSPTLSQEQIFESLKRVRACLLTRGIANVLHNVLPTPCGPRIAHVRVPEPIAIDLRRVSSDASEQTAYVEWLTEETRERMQAALDAINREIATEVGALSHPNPFVERGDAQRRDVESSASKPWRMDSGTRNADPCRIPRGVLSESENGSRCSKSRVRTAP
jgi:hypothetical protein